MNRQYERLKFISGHAIGRDAFIEEQIIVPLSQLFDDKEDIARKNAHLAIEMISETPCGRRVFSHNKNRVIDKL